MSSLTGATYGVIARSILSGLVVSDRTYLEPQESGLLNSTWSH